jgi:glyoxylase-like metal-dependent hydrolase (beta-lactamase superfamily II)
MREIVAGIFTFGIFAERFGYDFNGYYVADGKLCIDPVEPDDAVLAELVRRGVTTIVLTNRNHYRAAAKVKSATGARVAVHPADAAFVRDKGVAVDDDLTIGERVGPFTIVAADGKSPGEVALHWPSRRLLIVGDACVGKAPGVLGLLPEKVIDDLPRLRESLRRLSELDVETLLVADGHSVLEKAGSVMTGFFGAKVNS